MSLKHSTANTSQLSSIAQAYIYELCTLQRAFLHQSAGSGHAKRLRKDGKESNMCPNQLASFSEEEDDKCHLS
jgi:hypothetical protein